VPNIEISVNVVKIQDPKTTANIYNEYYTSIVQNILCGNPLSKSNEVSSVKFNSSSMFLTPPTEVEVVGIIKVLGNKKIDQ
jgi:hypothetical protein